MARWNGTKVAASIVAGVRAKRPPPALLDELVEQGIASRDDADAFGVALSAMFQLVAQRRGKFTMPELEEHLRGEGLPKKLVAAALKVAQGLATQSPAPAEEGRAITIDTVVDCLVAGLAARAEPEELVARLVALELPPELAQLQVQTLGRALTVASGAYTVTLEELFAELADHVKERGFPEPVVRTTARVLERLHGQSSGGDEGDE